MFVRSENLVYPKVWSRFTRTMSDGTVKIFRIQDVPENMYDDLMGFMEENFLNEEPITLAAGILRNKENREQMRLFWREYVLPEKLSLICFEDNDFEHPVIVGVNFLMFCSKDEVKLEKYSEPPDLLKIINELDSKYDIYEMFNITEYLSAAGLAINKDYRGMNIGAELLYARTPLCKAIGIKVTETIFSVVGSQILASKVGFETLLEIEYGDLEKKLNVKFPGSTKTIKIMVKVII